MKVSRRKFLKSASLSAIGMALASASAPLPKSEQCRYEIAERCRNEHNDPLYDLLCNGDTIVSLVSHGTAWDQMLELMQNKDLYRDSFFWKGTIEYTEWCTYQDVLAIKKADEEFMSL